MRRYFLLISIFLTIQRGICLGSGNLSYNGYDVNPPGEPPPAPCNTSAYYHNRGCDQPNCTCPPGTCRPGSCPCFPSAPARGVDCSLSVVSMGLAVLLVVGLGAIILSTSSAHVHDDGDAN